ncbi:MAG: hypothetical protein MR913_04400 [Clostridiales bacterium]|nr:hypothetical protein [Clostridiales bacterium]
MKQIPNFRLSITAIKVNDFHCINRGLNAHHSARGTIRSGQSDFRALHSPVQHPPHAAKSGFTQQMIRLSGFRQTAEHIIRPGKVLVQRVHCGNAEE